jgi:hypothetical protein
MYVKPPGSHIGLDILCQWFENSPSGKFRLILDPELDTNFASLKDINKFYPGIKTFAVVVNPWARIKIIYDSLPEKANPISHLSGIGLDEFILKLSNFKDNANWPFSFAPLTPQTDWMEYTDDSGNLQTVDYVFTAENMVEEFKIIQDYFMCYNELSSPVIPDYRDYYNDTSKNIIAEYFKKDIEKFNYKF